jgi:hypothetical protein
MCIVSCHFNNNNKTLDKDGVFIIMLSTCLINLVASLFTQNFDMANITKETLHYAASLRSRA